MDTFHVQFQKKRMLGLVLIAFAVVLVSFGIWHMKKEKEMPLFIEGVSKITITTLPKSSGIFENFEIVESNEINAITDFFNGLALKKTNKNTDEYGGMSYLLAFYFEEERSVTIDFFGNMFITVNHETYEVSYSDAQLFDKVIGNIVLERYNNSKKDTPVLGEITDIFISENENSRKRICMLESSEKEIDISNSYVYNIKKNSSWGDLHKGDNVAVYLQENTQIADVVFINP